MNKKLILTALLLFIIVSLGAVSAEDISDEAQGDVLSPTDTVLSEGEGDEPAVTEINIADGSENAAIQEQINTSIKSNTVINFAENGNYDSISLIITNTTQGKLQNITINGNGATLTGNLTWDNSANNTETLYCKGIFNVRNVNGFTITGFNFVANKAPNDKKGTTLWSKSCLSVMKSSNGTIIDNNVTGGRFGIFVGTPLRNTNFTNYDISIINNKVSNTFETGIIAFASPHTRIINNTVLNVPNHGIDVRFNTGEPFKAGENCIVEGNNVTGAMEGIYLMHSNGHRASDNTLTNCTIGITCYGSGNILLDSNIFKNVKIAHLLSSGYRNINITATSNYADLITTPNMPPTFKYWLLRGDSSYNNDTSIAGVYSDSDFDKNESTIKVSIKKNELDTEEIADGSYIVFTDELLNLNQIIEVQIFKDETTSIGTGKAVTVTINGVEANYTSENGKISIDSSLLTDAVNSVNVKFDGDDTLAGSSWTGVFKIESKTPVVVKENTAFTASDASAKALSSGVYQFKFSLKNVDVKIAINGAEQIVHVDANGIGKVSYKFNAAGRYTVSGAYLGSDAYNGAFFAKKITISKNAVAIKSTTTKVKKSQAAKAKIKITVKSNGKALKGKKVTLSINGKTYSAKVASNGVATFKVKLAKKAKKYSYKVEFAGDDAYSAKTFKGKLAVK